jgi:CHASE2 domain-containing sensor protein
LLENARIAEIPRVSAADVLDNVDAVHTALAGKAVFVGVTAAGVDSMLGLAKSMGGTLVPAVVFHAEAYEALRAGATAAPMGQIGVVLLSAALLLLGSWVNRQVEPRSPQLGLAVVLLPASCSALLLFLGGIWFPPVAARNCFKPPTGVGAWFSTARAGCDADAVGAASISAQLARAFKARAVCSAVACA